MSWAIRFDDGRYYRGQFAVTVRWSLAWVCLFETKKEAKKALNAFWDRKNGVIIPVNETFAGPRPAA